MAKQKKEPKSVSKPPSNSKPWLMDKKLYALIIFVFGFALYANTLFNDYNLDDELVTRNHQVTSKGWNVLKFNFDAFNSVELQDSCFSQKLKYFMPVIFRVPYYQDNAGFKYEYRPMVFASFALEHALFSKKDMINGSEVETDSAAISHFINILMYSLLCTLLFFILCNIFKTYNIIFPFIICLMFTTYPMHTEVVASIKNRDEILALIFGLLSLKFSLDYAENNKVISLLWVLVFFLLGILSKPTTISFALLIPLCIIFFKNVSYLKLMLLTAVLAFPSIFYSRLYSAFQQVALAFVLFAAVTGLYIFKNRGFFATEIKNIFATIPKYFKSTANSRPTEENHLDLHSLKTPSAILLFIFGVLIPVAIAAGGIYLHNAVMACAPLVLVGVLYSFVNDELKLAFTTPLTLITLFAICTFFHNQTKLIETALIVFLASQIFSGQKYFRTVGLINYLIFSVVSIIWLHSIQFVFILFFIGFLNRKLFNLTLVLVAVSALLFARKTLALFHGHSSLNVKALMFPIFYLFIFLLWKQKWRQATNIAASIIPLALIFYFVWVHPGGSSNAYLAVQGAYHNVNRIKAADPTPVQSIRPLNYPEYPLKNTDPLAIKFGTSMEVLGKYLRMVIVPYPMSFYYGYSCIVPQNISEAIPFLSLLIHLLLLGVSLYFFQKIPMLSFSILFYLISIAIFSNLITPIPGMVADRFLLIPSIGFCIALVYLISKSFQQDIEDDKLTLSALKQPLKISLAVILLLYSGLTFSRNNDWKDRVTLFRHDITVVENSAQAQNLLAVHLLLLSNKESDHGLQKQLRLEAVPHFKKALAIYPEFLNASYDLGRTYELLQLNDEALAQYQTTVKIDTHFVAPYFNMGAILHNKGQYIEAIPMYQKFLTQYPKQLEAYTNLSFAYFKLNDFEKSIATNRAAIKATGNPYYPTINIAKTYTVMNQLDSALFYFEQAHAMQPNNAGINANIEELKNRMQHK